MHYVIVFHPISCGDRQHLAFDELATVALSSAACIVAGELNISRDAGTAAMITATTTVTPATATNASSGCTPNGNSSVCGIPYTIFGRVINEIPERARTRQDADSGKPVRAER